MKKIIFLSFIIAFALPMVAQDSIVERNVTIEREFKPIIQDAGKIQTSPSVFVPTIKSQKVDYTNFSKPLNPAHSFNNLGMAEISLIRPKTQKGFARIGGGYLNSLGDFSYNFLNSKDMKLNFMLNHSGIYNEQKLTNTDASINFSKLFNKIDFYVGANGNHTYFNQYGQAYNALTNSYDKSALSAVGKKNLGTFRSKIGIQSIPTANIKYQLQTGYELFMAPDNISEHQVKTIGNIDWGINQHAVGLDFAMQNLFYNDSKNILSLPANTLLNIEPFYAWRGDKFNVHVGVNLDFATNSTQIFKPSPNVHAEWNMKDFISIYGGITGEYTQHSLQSAFTENRYIGTGLLFSEEMATYKPIDTRLGIKIRPQKNLLLNIYGNYDYTIDQYYYAYNQTAGYFDITQSNTTHVSAGIEATYHYKDIVKTSANFAYNYWNAEDLPFAYDRPEFLGEISAQVKVIHRLYLQVEGFFASKSYGLTTTNGTLATETLKAMYDVNLSASYLFSKNFSAFASFNNIINNKHELYYAHQVQGFNFLVGVNVAF